MESTIGCFKCLFSTFLFLILICLQIIDVISFDSEHLIKSVASNITTTIDFPDFDATIPPNLQNQTDHHVYYNSTLYNSKVTANLFWVDLDKISEAVTHQMLSDSHRRAATVQLSFPFPFYGQFVSNITIATGGFLYMGDHIHSWIAATQYIAPLMANFDPSISNTSSIKYYDNGTAFTVLWDNVILKEKASEGGAFKFETTLYQNGDIAFIYKNIPFPITEISNESHPVKIGISDAYVLERTSYFFRKKIIYEYHKADLKHLDIGNDSVIHFTALPTCLKFKDCTSCESGEIGFECVWCEANKKCSDGLDRNRQEWLQLNCIGHKNKSACPKGIEPTQSVVISPKTTHLEVSIVTTPAVFSPSTKNLSVQTSQSPLPSITTNPSISSELPSSTTTLLSSTSLSPSDNSNTDSASVFNSMKISKVSMETKESGIGAGGVFAIILVIVLIVGVGIWMFYAYKHPQSSSGQFLIKYRPSQWHWKGEDSRSYHM